MTDVELSFAKEALGRLADLAKESRQHPPRPRVMKMLDHVDVMAIVDFYNHVEDNTNAIIKMYTDAAMGLHLVKQKCESGGRRDEIISIVNEYLDKIKNEGTI